MSSTARDARLIELVAAFTEMGPAWMRWVQAAIPDDTVSSARLRVLNALECHPDGLTMTKLAQALEVTGRRVTALVDALTEDGLVERYAHPTDGRSTIVEITEAGRAQQRQVWEEHQGRVAVAFGDLSDEDQVRLLDISHKLTAAFRRRLAERAAPVQPACGGDPDAVLIRNNRRVRPPRPQSS
jgi:DNA-binding MarR family transcriptional regulator